MPDIRDKELRFRTLDKCFSNFRRKYTFDDLLEVVNEKLERADFKPISIRTLRYDINEMQYAPYNAPIKAYPYYGKKMYYRYEDEDFSLYKNELSTEDMDKLRSAIEMLRKYRGSSANAWLEEVISNLEYRFGVKTNPENLVEFAHNDQLKGKEFLSDLIDCTINHQPISITYCPYSGKEETTILHPYYMKQYNNRWFLFGLEENQEYGNRLTNKALDRIVRFSVKTDVLYIPNTTVDFQNYFKDIVGVTRPKNMEEPVDIILQFDEKRFPYVVSKPIHASQEILNPENHILKITVLPNKELEANLLSFGAQVEVLEPDWFRAQLAKKIEENYKKYLSVQNSCTEE